MRIVVALTGAFLLACAAPAAGDEMLDQQLSQIRTWTQVMHKDGVIYYISPEITSDNSRDRTFKEAEIFDELFTDDDYPDRPGTWGYTYTRSYNCASQTVRLLESSVLYVNEVYTTAEDGEPVALGEIRAEEGIKYFEHACGS